jgi:hypothetical protein
VEARAFDGNYKYICAPVRGGNPTEADANARLIAAAPELLAALKSINRLTSPGNRTLDDFMRDMDLACDISRAAIAKATEPAPMTAPVRIQRKRTAGWKMPPNTIYVGRPTMWGNFVAKACCIEDRAEAVAAYRGWIDEVASDSWKGRARIDLRGKNLACWCRLDQPCHADVLLELANR